MQKGRNRSLSFYFCLFLRYRKISVFTNHTVAIAVIPKIAFIDQLYAKVAVFIAFQFSSVSITSGKSFWLFAVQNPSAGAYSSDAGMVPG